LSLAWFAGRGRPRPVAGRSLRPDQSAFWADRCPACARSDLPALRHPVCAGQL